MAAEIPFSLDQRAAESESSIPPLRILVNGQGQAAADLFNALTEDGHQIVGVVATKKENDPLRILAMEKQIPIIDLGRVNKKSSTETMKGWEPDLAVGMFLQATLERQTYSIPKYGTLNFHISALPKRRGRDSMSWAILEGDPEIGMSAYLMNNRIDAGPVVRQVSYKNPGDKSQGALYYQHLPEAIGLMRDAVNDMAYAIDERESAKKERRKKGIRFPLPKLPLTVQDEKEATSQPPLTKTDMEVDFDKMSAAQINRIILAGGPGAWIRQNEGILNISKPAIIPGSELEPGIIQEIAEDGIVISAKEDSIKIGTVQKSKISKEDGKIVEKPDSGRIPAKDFADENHLETGKPLKAF